MSDEQMDVMQPQPTQHPPAPTPEVEQRVAPGLEEPTPTDNVKAAGDPLYGNENYESAPVSAPPETTPPVDDVPPPPWPGEVPTSGPDTPIPPDPPEGATTRRRR